jgi:hypothetical protein
LGDIFGLVGVAKLAEGGGVDEVDVTGDEGGEGMLVAGIGEAAEEGDVVVGVHLISN